jgi:endonuclease/exonuclease/phosphatase family metal-dependent hydrolase
MSSTQDNPYAATASEFDGMSARRFSRYLAYVFASSCLGGIVGALAGALIGLCFPGYYRAVMFGGDQPGFDPVSVAAGLGAGQGLVWGGVLGVAVLVAYFKIVLAGPKRQTHHAALWLLFLGLATAAPQCWGQDVPIPNEGEIRIATFNVSLNRPAASDLVRSLKTGKDAQARAIAAVIQQVRPDVLLINEFDWDEKGDGLQLFLDLYLARAVAGNRSINYRHLFQQAVNTGVDSGRDLDGDGFTGGLGDTFGFGRFPGQYGMAILSRFPIRKSRTFRTFLWRDMPAGLWPRNPESLRGFYRPSAADVFRLSSKSHWDISIDVEGLTIHLLAAHPTPPVFDGSEDRNGRRNHDEIRFWADYVGPSEASTYIYDDLGCHGGLPSGSHFVVLGDLNADPQDGDSVPGAIQQLLTHPAIDSVCIPTSAGGRHSSATLQGVNQHHRGDPAADTASFSSQTTGNLRVDYVLPSRTLTCVQSGVYWTWRGSAADATVVASDHRLVWIDIDLTRPDRE